MVTDPQVVQIFWNGLMTEVMMTAFLMSAEPDDGAPLSPIRLIILAVIGAGTLVGMAMFSRMVKGPPLAVPQLSSRWSWHVQPHRAIGPRTIVQRSPS